MTKPTRQLIECVPNFSEGRDERVIADIAAAINGVSGVVLLNVDPGKATNRTVYTFAGEPRAVCEAAFRAARTAAGEIDMRKHHGEHPRIGATDVLPLVPISGITLKECAEMARSLAMRMADEIGIPCYCYEAAAFAPERRDLAVCRSGEYEGIAARLGDERLRPDYGARPYDEAIARTGCSVVGAREYLIAVNFNLNTKDTSVAMEIARDVRSRGRAVRDAATGAVKHDEQGRPIMERGSLKGVKAIGWYIEEYGIAQVSMNITDISATPLHVAFEEVKRCAKNRGAAVTGTEIIGMVPERVLTEAGRYYCPTLSDDDQLVSVAIERLGLNDLRPFVANEKIIERKMATAI